MFGFDSKGDSAPIVTPDMTYQSRAAPKIPATIPLHENGFAVALSPALEWMPVDEAALVD
jgi:hypothetical protein